MQNNMERLMKDGNKFEYLRIVIHTNNLKYTNPLHGVSY